MKGYKPLGDSIVIKISGETEETTTGGVIIPLDTATNFENMAHEVMAVSDKSKETIGVKVGDYIVLREGGRGRDLQVNKNHYIQYDSFNILGVTKKGSYPTTINEILSLDVRHSKVVSN